MSKDQFNCRYCHTRRPLTESHWVVQTGMICINCLEERYFTCPGCNRLVAISQKHTVGDLDMCANCYSTSNYWPPQANSVSIASYDTIGSQRKYGIELESHTNDNHRLLRFRDNSIWGAKSDCTVRGCEFYSPILYGDQGLNEVRRLCSVANELGWHVHPTCGYHLHLDMRDEMGDSLRSIAYAFMAIYDVLRRCVASDRHNGSTYCRQHLRPVDIENADDFLEWAGYQDRYNFMNVSAYFQHGTFENRLHEGTFNEEAVCNWVILNLRIADIAAKHTMPELKDMLVTGRGPAERWFVIKDWLKDKAVAEFYERRIATNSDWLPTETPITITS
jgi:hypothetical protein